MGEQLTLDAAPEVDHDPGRSPSLQERFDTWLADNPHVFAEVVRVARHFRDAGDRVSINRVFEELRERLVTVGDRYRLNQDWRAPMARLVMDRCPDLDGYFATRRSQVDDERGAA